ncbi:MULTISPECIES: hypothetical protein [unclassified Alishewanella]|uniref:hypothetical protein n=1 Tax=unclassified Alishewanella TaxID=2628974 RepID=UPI0040411158
MATHFTDEKSRQLVFYASRFLRGQLPHHELHLFIWDTLEEWAALQQRPTTPLTRKNVYFGICCISWNFGLNSSYCITKD